MVKQLVNFITCGCESSAPFCMIYKAGREPTPQLVRGFNQTYTVVCSVDSINSCNILDNLNSNHANSDHINTVNQT
jgi:hypothetical protein